MGSGVAASLKPPDRGSGRKGKGFCNQALYNMRAVVLLIEPYQTGDRSSCAKASEDSGLG